MASTTSRQPPWFSPQGATLQPHLKIYNSLTRSKVPFVPVERDHITWYACGPTVYDDAHLGHARNYVSTDILRRILRDYFKFNVRFVMNITDVDDKIILRGRQRYLYDEYKTKHRYIDTEVVRDVLKAWHLYIKKNLPRIRLDPPPSPLAFHTEIQLVYSDILKGLPLEQGGKAGDKEAKVKMHINTAQNTARALTADLKTLTPDAFYNLTNDAMCAMLDAELGHTIKGTDHQVFTKLTQEYENRFFQDMKDLNVLEPDEVVKVTESGEDIAQFVDKIVKNKFAYATPDGSVYFDIKAFEGAGNPYARLEPWSRGDKSLQADGEGALSQRSDGKRSDSDFALWKSTKPGEPSWDSPWGPGRPGWHIECSAMASARFGKQMDIHSGGIDLAFPHHDNELAQSEAFWTEGKPLQWVNYFLHMGHLSIQGSKMSKSLKNFTTIRAALDRREWTSRSLRIVFLLGNWRDGIEITDSLVKEGTGWEDRVDNFFINVNEVLNDSKPRNDKEPILKTMLATANSLVNQHLLDSFNTPAAMNAISQLITEYNSQVKTDLTYADHYETGIFVTRLVNIFGLNGDGAPDTKQIGWQGIEIPDAAKKFVYPLAKMRDELRQAAIAKEITPEKIQEIVSTSPALEEPAQTGRPRPSYARAFNDFKSTAISTSTKEPTEKSKDINKEILALCDRVRDVDLWNLNIYLEDRENAPALVRPVTEGLRAARREREEKSRQKEEVKKQREAEAKSKLEKGRVSAEEMYKQPNNNEYSAWDADGVPTHAQDGTALTQSRIKKLKKDWERQKKAHDTFLQAVKDGVIQLQSQPRSQPESTPPAPSTAAEPQHPS